MELRLPMRVRVVKGERLGTRIVNPHEVSVFYGPRLFAFVDTKNLEIVPPLVSLDLSEQIQAAGPDTLKAWARTTSFTNRNSNDCRFIALMSRCIWIVAGVFIWRRTALCRAIWPVPPLSLRLQRQAPGVGR